MEKNNIIDSISLQGFRGYNTKRNIKLAKPDGERPGSGLTILVGPNNAGKTSIIEAVYLMLSNADIIPNEYSNFYNPKMEIEICSGSKRYSYSAVFSETPVPRRFINNELQTDKTNNFANIFDNIFILSNHRNFNSVFSNNYLSNRKDYKSNINGDDYRGEGNNSGKFGSRLIKIGLDKFKYDSVLKKVLNPLPKWSLKSFSFNNKYLEFEFNESKHSSKASGEGYINLFNIIDALYDSSQNNIIFIDEPEISLHPDLQKKLFNLLLEYSKDKQIIITTHSPYFVRWDSLLSSKLVRFKKLDNEINTYTLSQKSIDIINGFLFDKSNVHTLFLDSSDVFFLNDNIILTEGKDDVVGYKALFQKMSFINEVSFFGWGSGGVDNIPKLLKIFEDLGYQKIFVIIDGNKREKVNELETKFPKYKVYAIEPNDIRDKKNNLYDTDLIDDVKNAENLNLDLKNRILQELKMKTSVNGYVKKLGDEKVKIEFKDDFEKLTKSITNYFKIKPMLILENNVNVIDNTNEENDILKMIEPDYERRFDDYMQKNCPYFATHCGCQNLISIKKVNKTQYYVIMGCGRHNSDYGIDINFHYLVDIVNGTFEFLNKEIVNENLPLCFLSSSLSFDMSKISN